MGHFTSLLPQGEARSQEGLPQSQEVTSLPLSPEAERFPFVINQRNADTVFITFLHTVTLTQGRREATGQEMGIWMGRPLPPEATRLLIQLIQEVCACVTTTSHVTHLGFCCTMYLPPPAKVWQHCRTCESIWRRD